MGIVTIKPDATISYDNAPTLTGGASTHAVWADTNDGTYTADHSNLLVSFANPSIPSGAKITSVQLWVNVKRGATYNGNVFLYFNQSNADPQGFTPFVVGAQVPANQSPGIWFTGAAHTRNRLGAAWSVADLNALQFTAWDDTPASTIRITEVLVNITYNERPTVSAVLPSTVTTTTRPTITWTYTDPDGDLQERARVKIFSSAEYGAGGFDPETSAATYDSGVLYQPTTSHRIDEDLVVGSTYKWYVKAADRGSAGNYSTWVASSAVVINPVLPGATTI